MGCLYAILAGIAATAVTFFAGYVLAVLIAKVAPDPAYGYVGWVLAVVACPVVVVFAMAYAVRIPTRLAKRKARQQERAHGFPIVIPPADRHESNGGR
jgi:preprotein translocase subunit SecY